MMIKLRMVLAGLLTGPADSWGVMVSGQAAGGSDRLQVGSWEGGRAGLFCVGARRWAREG